jgi:hypothetical protein
MRASAAAVSAPPPSSNVRRSIRRARVTVPANDREAYEQLRDPAILVEHRQ